MTPREIIYDLLRRVQNADFNPHNYGCERRRGLALTQPEECTCGLRQVEVEARALTGLPPTGYIPKEQPPVGPREPWR